jgi:hypothetical protein
MTETFYDVLGVDRGASQEEITDAYRRMVKEYHPDVSEAPDAAERFKKVVQAEEVLADPEEREKYDELGHAAYLDRVHGENAAGAEQSPWTTGDRRNTANGDGREGATAGANVGFGKGAKRQAGADWTTGSTNNRWSSDGYRSGDGNGADGTYTVHDWDDADAAPDTVTVDLTQDKAVVGVLMFFLYPVFVWFTVNPSFPLVMNLAVGVCTLLSVGYFLTLPTLGLGIFGAWSVISPLAVVLAFDWGLGASLLAIGACWIPFGYSVVVAYVTMPE